MRLMRFDWWSVFGSMEEHGDCNMCFDTDSDTAERKDGTKCNIKWTQEEVSEGRLSRSFIIVLT